MTPTIIAVLVIAGIVGFGYLASYNKLIYAKQGVAEAWATIDAELERRHALVPGLVESVKSSAAHERALLEQLARARTAATEASHTAAARSTPEHELTLAAHAVIALREQYPALNTQQNFLTLQHELAITEDRISAARRFYNIKVADWNRRLQAIPSNLVGRRHSMVPAAYFEE